MAFVPNRKRGGPMVWQGDQTAPTGYQEVTMPAFSQNAWFADFMAWVRSLYNCANVYHHIHACRLGGYTATELLEAVTAALDINGLTAVTPASGDEFVLADASDSYANKKVTLANLVTALELLIQHNDLQGLTTGDPHTQYMLDAGTSTAGNLPSFSNTDGRTMTDSGVAAGSVVTANGTDSGDFAAANRLIVANGNTKVVKDIAIDASEDVGNSESTIKTPDSGSGATYDMLLKSGNASSGDSGGITVDVGTASGTTGVINVGTANASAVNIGRTGITNTITGTTKLVRAAVSSITEATAAALDLTGALSGSDVRRRWIPFRVSITGSTNLVTWAIASGANYRFRLKCLVKRTDSGNESAWVDYGWVVQDIGGTVTVTAEANNSIDGVLSATAPAASSSKGATPLLIDLSPNAGTEVWNGVLEVEGPCTS